MFRQRRNQSLACRLPTGVDTKGAKALMATRNTRTVTPRPERPKPTSSLAGPGTAIAPPIEPMLAKLADELPAGDDVIFEPKWDGFRAIVFRNASDVFIQSRDLRPLDRYFPEL